ncbi:DUF445 family protein [Fibrobacterales bacterium]|nr:DUF445 family protein [Fibrobacterales bacterium]
MTLPQMLLLPVLASGIGWFTNWLAIKMLTKPLKPISILGFKIQGILPRRKEELAERVSEAVSRDFLKSDDVKELISSDKAQDGLRELFSDRKSLMVKKMMDAFPGISMFMTPELLAKAEEQLDKALLEPEFLETIAMKLAEGADVKDIVKRNIIAFDFKKLDEIINEIASQEFKVIEILGAVLGFIVGALQIVLIQFVF